MYGVRWFWDGGPFRNGNWAKLNLRGSAVSAKRLRNREKSPQAGTASRVSYTKMAEEVSAKQLYQLASDGRALMVFTE